MAEEEEGDEEDDDDFDDDEEDTDAEAADEEEKEDEDDEKEVPMKYSEFWEEFGKSIKLGVIEDSKNRKKLMQLLRFKSTRSPEKAVSLQSYVDNMPEKQ